MGRELEVEALKLPHVEKDPLSFMGVKPAAATSPKESADDGDDEKTAAE